MMMTDDQLFQDLVGVISTRGHYVNQEYVPKEMAIKCFGDDQAFTYHFYNEDVWYHQLDEHEKLLCQHIHDTTFDIPYDKAWFGMLYPSAIKYILQTFEDTEPIGITVGYYGGAYERAILDLVGIRGVNLKDYGCPDSAQLKIEADQDFDYEGCGMHTSCISYKCCKTDVLLYEHWVLNDVYLPTKPESHKNFRSKNILNFLNLQRDFVKSF